MTNLLQNWNEKMKINAFKCWKWQLKWYNYMIRSYSFQNPCAFRMACATFETTAQKTLAILACRDIWWSSFRWSASLFHVIQNSCSSLRNHEIKFAVHTSSQTVAQSSEQVKQMIWFCAYHLQYAPASLISSSVLITEAELGADQGSTSCSVTPPLTFQISQKRRQG